MLAQTAIDIENITYRVKNKRILNGVSIKADCGDFISVIGPNGAGKTTLLRCIARLIKPSSGKISVFGKPLASFSQKDFAKTTAYVPQKNNILYPFTVEEFVKMGRYPYKSPFDFSYAGDTELTTSILEKLNITRLRHRKMTTLSGGEAQKAVIAGCLAQEPKIMLLDEVMAYLDPNHQQDLNNTLHSLNKNDGITILSVTHDINFALLFSKKILALVDGEIAFFGEVKDIGEGDLKRIYGIGFDSFYHPESKKKFFVPEWEIYG